MDIKLHIPKEFEKDFLGNWLPGIDKGGFTDFFERIKCDLKTSNHIMCGNYEFETLEMLQKAFLDAKNAMESEHPEMFNPDYYAELEKKHLGDPEKQTGIYDSSLERASCVVMNPDNSADNMQSGVVHHRRGR